MHFIMHLASYLADRDIRDTVVTLLGTLLTGMGTFIGRYHRAARVHTEKKLDIAVGDIAFLLAVVQGYGELLDKHGLPNSNRALRAQARADGYTWSGRFTPGRVASRAAHSGEIGVEIRRALARMESAAAQSREGS